MEFADIATDYTAIASIRATQQMVVNQHGRQFKAIQGVRSSDLQKVTLYPGSVPSKLPVLIFGKIKNLNLISLNRAV